MGPVLALTLSAAILSDTCILCMAQESVECCSTNLNGRAVIQASAMTAVALTSYDDGMGLAAGP